MEIEHLENTTVFHLATGVVVSSNAAFDGEFRIFQPQIKCNTQNPKLKRNNFILFGSISAEIWNTHVKKEENALSMFHDEISVKLVVLQNVLRQICDQKVNDVSTIFRYNNIVSVEMSRYKQSKRSVE